MDFGTASLIISGRRISEALLWTRGRLTLPLKVLWGFAFGDSLMLVCLWNPALLSGFGFVLASASRLSNLVMLLETFGQTFAFWIACGGFLLKGLFSCLLMLESIFLLGRHKNYWSKKRSLVGYRIFHSECIKNYFTFHAKNYQQRLFLISRIFHCIDSKVIKDEDCSLINNNFWIRRHYQSILFKPSIVVSELLFLRI